MHTVLLEKRPRTADAQNAPSMTLSQTKALRPAGEQRCHGECTAASLLARGFARDLPASCHSDPSDPDSRNPKMIHTVVICYIAIETDTFTALIYLLVRW